MENSNLVKAEILQHLQSRFKLIEVMYKHCSIYKNKHCSLFKAEILQHLQYVGGKISTVAFKIKLIELMYKHKFKLIRFDRRYFQLQIFFV